MDKYAANFLRGILAKRHMSPSLAHMSHCLILQGVSEGEDNQQKSEALLLPGSQTLPRHCCLQSPVVAKSRPTYPHPRVLANLRTCE